ncbi:MULTISPECIES: hypothetical protein [unclassified Frankia]|uniref:hypothetical protein n=1 Tax=unclassified Frankia TaxID=2632575 RepID=UPI002AD1F4F0|nr:MULTISPECIES: hypothetical protein [unclassified Frankia]
MTSGSGLHGYLFSMVGELGDRTVLAPFPDDKIFIGQAVWTVLVLIASFVFLWIFLPTVASRPWFLDATERAVGLVGTILLLPEDWILTRDKIPTVVEKVTTGYGRAVAEIFALLTEIVRWALPQAVVLGPSHLRQPATVRTSATARTSMEMNQHGSDTTSPDSPAPSAAVPAARTVTDQVVPVAVAFVVVLCFLWWNQARCVPGSPACVHPLNSWLTLVSASAKGSG